MNSLVTITEEELEKAYIKFKTEGEKSGYYLNPDKEFTKALIKGLLINEKRYGYMSCPCRLATKNKERDLDIICPCDYRDADVSEFGACYCGLYVSKEASSGKKKIEAVPERRKMEKDKIIDKEDNNLISGKLSLPVWRCKVCGYLCARENPPDICPICKVTKERFERFV